MSTARRARHLTSASCALGAALVVLAGCSGGDPAPGATSATPSATASSTTPTATPSATPTATPSPTGSAADTSTPAPTASAPTVAPSAAGTAAARGIPRTLRLEVTSVAGGCVYGSPPGTEQLYALRGRVPAVSPGDLLTVSGAADDTAYAACPDGRPFLVSTATRTG